MATFTSLPTEIRLMIYDYIFPPSIQVRTPLGFPSPSIESHGPNVNIDLPAKILLQLYNSNPAGESKGRFWKPPSLFSVSRMVREESQEVWGRLPVRVFTWMSFLANRPLPLLIQIHKFEFRVLSWQPRQTRLTIWMRNICNDWADNLRKTRLMYPNGCDASISTEITVGAPVLLRLRLGMGAVGRLNELELLHNNLEELIRPVISDIFTRNKTGKDWWTTSDWIYNVGEGLSSFVFEAGASVPPASGSEASNNI